MQRVLGWSLWAIAAGLVMAEQFSHRRMRSYIVRHYPDLTKKVRFGFLWRQPQTKEVKARLKGDPEFQRISRVGLTLSLLTAAAIMGAAELSGWNFFLF